MFRLILVLACILLLFPSAVFAASIPVTILYTADTHGHIESKEGRIGLDMIAALHKSLPGSILLDAGDFLYGSPIVEADQGKSVVDLMGKAGYFAATLGNNEFAYGLAPLADRLKEAASTPHAVQFISANVLFNDAAPLCPAYAKTTVSGINLCVFGLTTPTKKIAKFSDSANTVYIGDPLQYAEKTVKTLRSSGCDIVIALTHLGRKEKSPVTSLDVAANIPGIDVIIDGHTHKELIHTPEEGPPVFSPKSRGQSIGKLTVTVENETRKVTKIHNEMLEAKDLVDMVPDAALQKSIGELAQRLHSP